jgi:hypothetical protein
VNLGPTINTAFADGAPALSSDATTLYFYSTRPGGSGSNDLYMTMRDRTPGGGEGDSSLVEFSRASGRSALPVSGSLHQPAARNQASHAGPAGEAVLSASAFIPSFAAETRVLPPVGVSLTGPRAAREVPPAPVPSQPSTALICRKAGGRQDEYLTAALLSGTAGQAAPGELSAATLDHVFAGLPDEGLAARSGGTPWW